MEAGQTVTFEDLCWLRPGDGLAPGLEDSVVGKKLSRFSSSGYAFIAGIF